METLRPPDISLGWTMKLKLYSCKKVHERNLSAFFFVAILASVLYALIFAIASDYFLVVLYVFPVSVSVITILIWFQYPGMLLVLRYLRITSGFTFFVFGVVGAIWGIVLYMTIAHFRLSDWLLYVHCGIGVVIGVACLAVLKRSNDDA